ncbi:hypothetical protein NNJEOMEG_00064 [Fundidesulfovibrio magnetotacticus]|uniref:Peptidase C14 caspase domain-containing protein n=1 Tax=Fundidesulfovibrio magnetotacticus TaxID=2730080 RepID=A0A6V8LHQ3_9BACT|nr:caspase family protein [Fundidesulfovibrio magnetotacticus]GFK92242.1 hypothetical protein NNJEOMEG_00064 [Fundidesulfovibrio magnetotacticus]
MWSAKFGPPFRFRAEALGAFLAALLLLLAAPTQAGEPPREPILRIETGTHGAVIKYIDADARGRFLVTASDDKTCRIWDAATGKPLRTLRPPVGRDANEGKLYTAAVSPDGSTVACGGWTEYGDSGGHAIFLFDSVSGKLLRCLEGLPNVIHSLAFSPDGTLLAAGVGGSNGIRLWRTKDWTLAGQDAGYDNVYGVAFDGKGRLAVTSYDGFVRLYDVGHGTLRLLAKAKSPGGELPFRCAFSSDGKTLAVGHNDAPRISLISVPNLDALPAPDADGTNDSLSKVAWLSDNRLAAGGMWDTAGQYPVRIWQDGGRGAFQDIALARSTLGGLKALPGSALAWAAMDRSLGVLESNGTARFSVAPALTDLRGNLAGFRLGQDGKTVSWTIWRTQNSACTFSLPGRDYRIGRPPEGLQPPRTAAPGLSVTDWEDKTAPKLGGNPLKLKDYEKSRSLAVAPDGKSFLLGTDWRLRLYNAAGELQEAPLSIPGTAWGLNIAPSGKVAVAALGDGTIRWYRLQDLREILALFPHPDGKRWVLWTPSGHYDASPGGEDLIGWHVNNGLDQAADFFPASRFRDQFHRPDVIDRVLDTLDVEQAVALADQTAGRVARSVDIARSLPPVVTILSPAGGHSFDKNTLTVKYEVRSPGGEEITGVSIQVDGRRAAEMPRGALAQSAQGQVQESTVTLPSRDARVAIVAENRHGPGVPAVIELRWAGAAPQAKGPLGRLYALCVGVGDYRSVTPKLNLPGKDAEDFARVLKLQKGTVYKDVAVKLLKDGEARREAILDGLAWLGENVRAEDTAILFMAGHGVNDDIDEYYFLPVDAEIRRLSSTAVDYGAVGSALKRIRGQRIVFLDTCHSGNLGKGMWNVNGLINRLSSSEKGVVVFSAATGQQFSYERPEWGNGAFTKALVEGLSGKAPRDAEGAITFKALDLYVDQEVRRLTGSDQTPVTAVPVGVPNFTVAVARKEGS